MNPPDHPTPRTNAIAHRGYPEPAYIVEMTDLARTLERELTETERLRFGADADRRRLRAEVERWELAFQEQYARAEKAEAEVERLEACMVDAEMYRQTREWAEKATERAKIAEARAERAEASAKLWEADALRYANNTEFWKARAEKAEAALAFIAENGGTTHETECGKISCNGLWCAEQARAAIDAAMKRTPTL